MISNYKGESKLRDKTSIFFLKNTKLVFITVILGIGSIGYLNYLSGQELNLFILFLIPCILAAWRLGMLFGLLSAVASVSIAFTTDVLLAPKTEVWLLAINAFVRICVFVLAIIYAIKIKKLTESLENISLQDALTGIGNKRALAFRGADEIERMNRVGAPLSVMFIDLDNFKEVNDFYGHASGDTVIKEVGRVLKETLRASDFPARIGGDEFAVLLYATDGSGAQSVAKDIIEELKRFFAQKKYNVTLSIGIATFINPPNSFEEALKTADNLMYSVKNTSKNGVLQKDFL